MPTTFKDFESVFLEHYSLMDDANVTRDKLCKLRQCSTIWDYITAFDSIVVLLPELPEVD